MTEMAGNAGPDRGLRGHPGDRRRGHRLRQPAERDPDRRRLRGGGRGRDPHRGPGGPEEVRPHGGQAGHPGRGDGAEDPGRGRRPDPARVRDHRPDRRPGGGGPGARPWTGPGCTARRAPTPCSSRRWCRRTEAAEAARAFPDVPLLFNWAEGGKTPPISLDRLRRARLPDRHLPDQHAARGDRRDAPDTAARSPGRAPRPAVLRDLPAFGEFLDFIGLPEVREAEQRYGS